MAELSMVSAAEPLPPVEPATACRSLDLPGVVGCAHSTTRFVQEMATRFVEQEQGIQLIFSHSPVPMALAVDDRLIEVNVALARLLRFGVLELQARRWQDITPVANQAEEIPLLQDVRAGRRKSYTLEKVLFTRSGGQVPVVVTAVGVPLRQGGYACFATVVPSTWQLPDERTFVRLSPRQAAILERVAEGHTDAAIARSLAVSRQAVVRHLGVVGDRLGATGRAEIVARAFHHDVFDIRVWPPRVRSSVITGRDT
ncbi:helix-turn-helix transcriptional regulator [Amycolatopsis sp. NPDC004378]